MWQNTRRFCPLFAFSLSLLGHSFVQLLFKFMKESISHIYLNLSISLETIKPKKEKENSHNGTHADAFKLKSFQQNLRFYENMWPIKSCTCFSLLWVSSISDYYFFFTCEFLKIRNYATILVWLLESQLQMHHSWFQIVLNIESWMSIAYEFSPQFCLLPMVMAHHQLPYWHGNNLLPPWCRLFIKYKKIIGAAGMQKNPSGWYLRSS